MAEVSILQNIAEFTLNREYELNLKLYKVLQIGLFTTFAGVCLFCLSQIILRYIKFSNPIIECFVKSFTSIFFIIYSSGVAIVCSAPYDKYDIDNDLFFRKLYNTNINKSKNYLKGRIVCYVTGIGIMMWSLLFVIFAPYFIGILLFCLGFLVFISSPERIIKPSYSVFIFCFIFPFCLALILLYQFIFASENINKNTLFNIIFVKEDVTLENNRLYFLYGFIFCFIWFISHCYIFKISLLNYNKENKISFINIIMGSIYDYKCTAMQTFFMFRSYTLFGGFSMLTESIGSHFLRKIPLYDLIPKFFISFSLFIPQLFLIIYSRENLYFYLSQRLENNINLLKRDGVFLAALLDSKDLFNIGDIHYIHMITANSYFMEFDFRRNWIKSVVVDIKGDVLHLLTDDNLYTTKTIINSNKSPNDLLKFAEENLRCIDWEVIEKNPEVFHTSVRDMKGPKCFDFSRQVKSGERINYFISHSWHDDKDTNHKYEILKSLSYKFKKKMGKFPTFWLDKVCIDQDNIGDGLKVLPINIMSCEVMLVLFGNTYINRLWCIWELYTFFCFRNFDHAVNHIIVLPITIDNNTINETSMYLKLIEFDYLKATCYDPNEYYKLLNIIETRYGIL